MFRKLHSNRNPHDTLWSSLGTEFAVYFGKAKFKLKRLLKTYPNQAFVLMVLMLLGSLVFMLTARGRSKPKSSVAAVKPVNSYMQNGLSQILTQAEAIRESLKLKEEIELLLSRDSLTHADTIHLEKAIDRLHQIQTHID